MSPSISQMRGAAYAAYEDDRVRAHPRLAVAARKVWLLVSMDALRTELTEDVVRCAKALLHAAERGVDPDVDEACALVENLWCAAKLGGAA